MRVRFAVFLAFAFCFHLTACGGPTTGPHAGTDGGVVAPPGKLVAGSLSTGSVQFGASVGLTIDVTASAYAFFFEGTQNTYAFSLFSDAAHTKLVDVCLEEGASYCVYTGLTPGTYYARIDTSSTTPVPYSILTVALVDEGSSAAPAPLADPGAFHTIAASGSSFYTFDAPVAGAYLFQTTVPSPTSNGYSFGGFSASFFAGADFSSTPVASCQSAHLGCGVDGLPSGKIGMRLDATALPAYFTTSVAHTLGEGALTELVPLVPGTPRAGSVDSWSRSFYGLATGVNGGGYTITLTSITTWAQIDVFALGSTTSLQTCYAATCLVSALDASTTYVVQVRSGDNGHYTIVAQPNGAEGSPNTPVVLVSGVAHTVTQPSGAESYYAFTPTQSGDYSLALSSSSSGWFSFGATCNFPGMPCDLGLLDAGVTYVFPYAVGTSGSSSTATLTLSGPNSEGTATSPIVLTPDVDHAGTLDAQVDNYYAFTTDASGGSYGIALATNNWIAVYTGTTGTTSADCHTAGAASACTFSGLPPNTQIVFHVWPGYTLTDPSLKLRLFRLAPHAGCEANSAACYTFESGTIPAAFSDASSGGSKPWAVTTAAADNGTYGYTAGSGTPCFQLSTSIGTFTLAYGLDPYSSSTTSSDTFTVTVDGTVVITLVADTAGYRRTFVAVDPAATHVVKFCSLMTATTHHAYIDDFAVR